MACAVALFQDFGILALMLMGHCPAPHERFELFATANGWMGSGVVAALHLLAMSFSWNAPIRDLSIALGIERNASEQVHIWRPQMLDAPIQNL
ncbi:hypothetical protein BS50DRAFT_576697, partial [Corynespora cassiicola Philippines]